MTRRHWFVLVSFGVGLVAGRLLTGPEAPASWLGVAPAHAAPGNIMKLDGSRFLSTDGGNAYVWSAEETGRVVLVGQCSRIDPENMEQALYVWLPAVERGF